MKSVIILNYAINRPKFEILISNKYIIYDRYTDEIKNIKYAQAFV